MHSRGPDGRTGHEEVTGNTPDISEYTDFEFCDLVWFRPHGKLNEGQFNAELALWIGISHRVGSDMSYWVLPKSGVVQSHTTVQHVTKEDHASAEHRDRIQKFLVDIKERLNDDNFEFQTEHEDNWMYLDDLHDYDPAFPEEGKTADYEGTFPDPAEDKEDAGVDNYLKAELVIETKDGPRKGTIVERAKHPDGRKIGHPHQNPIFDTREYFIQFPDESRDRFTANQIAENLYAQCDTEGHQYNLVEEITGHRMTDEALKGKDAYKTLKNGQVVPKRTTKGHQLCVKYRGDETKWIDLQTCKDANPIETAEYAISNGLDQEPAFGGYQK